GDRLQPADRRPGRVAARMVRALARSDVSLPRRAGRVALALHARRRNVRLGRRPGPARDRLREPDGAVGAAAIEAAERRFPRRPRENGAKHVIPWAWIERAQTKWTPDSGRGVK